MCADMNARVTVVFTKQVEVCGRRMEMEQPGRVGGGDVWWQLYGGGCSLL